MNHEFHFQFGLTNLGIKIYIQTVTSYQFGTATFQIRNIAIQFVSIEDSEIFSILNYS